MIQPLNALCLLALAGFFIRIKWDLTGQKIMNAALIMIVLLGLLPIGPAMLTFLERRYPTPAALPERVDGIIVLGGGFDAYLTQVTGHIAANDSVDRMLCFTDLAKKHPGAKLVFSGGAGDILNPSAQESNDARAYFKLVGLGSRDIVYETKSRNTYENVLYSMQDVAPKNAENWVVVTSAFHMPRTMGIFTHFGWKIIPYQCDHRTDGTYDLFRRMPSVTGNYRALDIAVREIVGSISYYITDKSAFILPPSSGKLAP